MGYITIIVIIIGIIFGGKIFGNNGNTAKLARKILELDYGKQVNIYLGKLFFCNIPQNAVLLFL